MVNLKKQSQFKANRQPLAGNPKHEVRNPKRVEWVAKATGADTIPISTDFKGCDMFSMKKNVAGTMLLSNIAICMGKKLNWDGENMKITNVPGANDYLHYEYREGWTL